MEQGQVLDPGKPAKRSVYVENQPLALLGLLIYTITAKKRRKQVDPGSSGNKT